LRANAMRIWKVGEEKLVPAAKGFHAGCDIPVQPHR
jgi:hypothetical protein